MPKKPLILIGIEGNLPEPLPKRGYQASATRALLPFGTVRRKENDLQKALEMALELRSNHRTLWVRDGSVEFKPKSLEMNWDDIAPSAPVPPGKIWVTKDIAHAYGKIFDFETQDEMHFLVGEKHKKERFRGLSAGFTDMVGRTKEFTELTEVLEQSFEDRGQIASIVGEGGLGKTRLWIDFEKYLDQEDVLYFFGQFGLADKKPFAAIRSLVVPFKEHFQNQIHLSQSQQDVWMYLTTSTPPKPWLSELSPEDLQSNIESMLISMLNQVANEKMVFVLDDVHWADQNSRAWIANVVASIPKRKHMWLLIHRPDYQPPFERELFYHKLSLQKFTEEQTLQHIQNVLEIDYIAKSIVKNIHHHTQGNPFFIEELFRHALDHDIIVAEQKIIQEFPLDKGIPLNVKEMVQTRLDHLDKKLFDALKILSLLGRDMLREEALGILSKKGLDAQATIESLMQDAYLAEVSVFPEDRIGFGHDIIYEAVVHENISQKEKLTFHRDIADFFIDHYEEDNLPLDRLCQHLMQIPFEKSFTPFFVRAAQHAYNQNHYRDSFTYYQYLFENDALADDNYPHFAATLEKVNEPKAQQIFLEHWKKTASPEKEHPIQGFYKYYLSFLTYERRNTEFEGVFEEAIRFYQNKYTDKELWELYNLGGLNYGRTGDWNKLIHLCLKMLRIYNDVPDAIEKTPFLHLLNYAYNHMKYLPEPLFLDTFQKGLKNILKHPNPPIDIQVPFLTRYAFFQTVYKCHYKKAANLHEKIIQIKQNQGNFAELDAQYAQWIVNLFFEGNYQKVLETFKKVDELTIAKRTRNYYISGYWKAFTLLILGKRQAALQCMIPLRHGRYQEAFSKVLKFYFLAHYHQSRGECHKAYVQFKRMTQVYSRMNINHMNVDAKGLMYTALAKHEKNVSAKVQKELKQLFDIPRVENSYNDWSFRMHALTLARFTDHDFGVDALAVDHNACPNALIKQKMFVEKILLLDHKGMHREADALREEYRAYRKKLSMYVPARYRESFDETPAFPVP